jgi:hypothetical protein
LPRRSKKRTPPGISQIRRHTIDRDGSSHTHEIRALHETDLINEPYSARVPQTKRTDARRAHPLAPFPDLRYHIRHATPCLQVIIFGQRTIAGSLQGDVTARRQTTAPDRPNMDKSGHSSQQHQWSSTRIYDPNSPLSHIVPLIFLCA